MKKMSLQQFKSLFPNKYELPVGNVTSVSATRKGFKHKVNPCFKPFKSELTPRQWILKQRAKKAKRTMKAKGNK